MLTLIRLALAERTLSMVRLRISRRLDAARCGMLKTHALLSQRDARGFSLSCAAPANTEDL
jgi:hypothetical protein